MTGFLAQFGGGPLSNKKKATGWASCGATDCRPRDLDPNTSLLLSPSPSESTSVRVRRWLPSRRGESRRGRRRALLFVCAVIGGGGRGDRSSSWPQLLARAAFGIRVMICVHARARPGGLRSSGTPCGGSLRAAPTQAGRPGPGPGRQLQVEVKLPGAPMSVLDTASDWTVAA